MSVRIAIIGLGNLAQSHLNVWRKFSEVEIVAFADPDLVASTDLIGVKMYSNVATMLRESNPDIVDICTSAASHLQYIELAAAAGYPIIVEGPMAATIEDCDKIIELVNRYNVPAVCGNTARYAPAYRECKRAVTSGAVGNPAAIRVERLAKYPVQPGGNTSTSTASPAEGMVLNFMSADFDWLLWCFGPIVRVFACGLTYDVRCAGQIDYALVTLRFQSGAIGHVTGSWAHSSGLRTSFEIAGDRGLLTYDSSLSNSVMRTRKVGTNLPASESPLTTRDDPYFIQLSEFLTVIKDRNAIPNNLNEAREAVKISLLALESMKTGRPIVLS